MNCNEMQHKRSSSLEGDRVVVHDDGFEVRQISILQLRHLWQMKKTKPSCQTPEIKVWTNRPCHTPSSTS